MASKALPSHLGWRDGRMCERKGFPPNTQHTTDANVFARNFKVLIIHSNCCQHRLHADAGGCEMASKLLATSSGTVVGRRATRIVHNIISNIRISTNITRCSLHRVCVCVNVCSSIVGTHSMRLQAGSWIGDIWRKPGTSCHIDFVCHSDFASALASPSLLTNSCTPECSGICALPRSQHASDRCRPIQWWMQRSMPTFFRCHCIRLNEEFSACQTANFCAPILRSFRSSFITAFALTQSSRCFVSSCVIERQQNATNINLVFRFNTNCQRGWYRLFHYCLVNAKPWKTIERWPAI